MTLLSRSSVHQFATMVLFCNVSAENTGIRYLHLDTASLVGEQNLAATLFECTSPKEIEEFLSSKMFRDLKAETEVLAGRKLTVIQLSVEDREADVEISYAGSSLSTAAIDACRWAMVDFLKIPTLLHEVSLQRPTVDTHFCWINVSKSFLNRAKSQLSSEYRDQFDEAQYVDSQLLLLMLAPALSGSADAI